MPSSLCTPREDGKAAEESRGSFMKKFSKTAYGTSVRRNLELKIVQSSAGSRKSSPVPMAAVEKSKQNSSNA